MLLIEILYDIAAAIPTSPLLTWHIKFSGVPFNETERSRLVSELRSLLPDLTIVDTIEGSVVAIVLGPERALKVLNRLNRIGLLASFFEVENVEIGEPTSWASHRALDGTSLIDKLARYLRDWRPRLTDNSKATEDNFAHWLEEWLTSNDQISGMSVVREPNFLNSQGRVRPDFLVTIDSSTEISRVLIELIRYRGRAPFIRALEYILQFQEPAILVVTGTPDELKNLEDEAGNYYQINPHLRIVLVPLDDG